LILTVLSRLSQGHVETLSIVWILAAVFIFFGVSYFLWSCCAANKVASYITKHYSKSSTGAYTRLFFASLVLSGAAAAAVGLEPVLGAFTIGVILSRVDNEIKHQTWEKIEGYIHIFVGGFLVSIGTMLPREALLSPYSWLLAVLFTALALLGKYIVKYLFKNRAEGHLVGLAMAIRGEVGLVFVAVAITNNVFDQITIAASLLAVIMVTVVGSILFEKSIFEQSGVRMEKPEEAL